MMNMKLLAVVTSPSIYHNQMPYWEGGRDKMPIPTTNSDILSTLIAYLASRKCQLCPCLWGRVGHASEIVTAKVFYEGEVRHIPKGCDRTFGQYPEGRTSSVAREVETIHSGYLNFDPGGMSTINWRWTSSQVSKYSRYHKGEPSSDPSQKPNWSSAIPIPEEFKKRLTRTPIMGKSQNIKGPEKLDQTDSLAINIYIYPHPWPVWR